MFAAMLSVSLVHTLSDLVIDFTLYSGQGASPQCFIANGTEEVRLVSLRFISIDALAARDGTTLHVHALPRIHSCG